MPSLAEKILKFNKSLFIAGKLPKGVEVMQPLDDKYVYSLCKKFYHQYYNDNHPRSLILAINPGRFGAGTTGIPFTDPKKLEDICGISNTFPKKTELSADFIYAMIERYGGAQKFYSNFLFSSISPLGFIRDGKNLNYYDDKKLEQVITPFAISCIKEQLNFGLNRTVCFCLGKGKNYAFLQRLNNEFKFFIEIIPLSHPRFIMQYRRKRVDEYIAQYLTSFERSSPR